MKIDCHLSKLEKDYNEFKLQYNKQNVEDLLIQRAVKTTKQILYDKGLFDEFQNADKVFEVFCLPQGEEETYQKIIHNYLYMSNYESLYLGDTKKNMGTDTYNYMSNTFNFMYTYAYNYVSV